MKALILAGGFGTRLREVVSDVPKPMVSILGKPFLEHQIRFLKEQGIKEVIIAVHYMSDKIKSYFGDGLRWGIEIIYSEEESPLGTAGAIKNAQKYLDDTFLVLNGDSYTNIKLDDFLHFHNSKKSEFSVCLARIKEAKHYGSVVLEGNKIIDFAEKTDVEEAIVNTGVYLFEPKIFDYIEANKKVSLEKEIFPVLAREGKLYGYRHNGYFIDIGRPETYNKFKEDMLNTLFIKKDATLRDAIKEMDRDFTGICLVVDENKKLLGVVTENVVNRHLIKGGSPDDLIENVMIKDPIVARVGDSDVKKEDMLRRGINRLPILDDEGIVRGLEFRTEKIKTEIFPVVRGKAPLRISFAGGGTDLPYFFEKYGGIVINATIDKYCHATMIKRADKKAIIDFDGQDEVIFDIRNPVYDGKLDIIKAIVKIIKPNFGFEVYLYNDIPPGRGLGSSASLAVLIVSLISHIEGKNLDDYKIAEIAHRAETEELGIKGGWQDQYAAVTGGFSFMEFSAEKNIIYPLRLKQETIHEFNEHLMLCYVGNPHFSGNLHQLQEKNFFSNETEVVNNLNELKQLAVKIKDCLLTNNLNKIGELMHESWQNKKKINAYATNPRIEELYNIGLLNGAIGGRLLGAGGGGYLLFFHQPQKRNCLKKALEKNGGEIMNFNFEFGGTIVRQVKNKS